MRKTAVTLITLIAAIAVPATSASAAVSVYRNYDANITIDKSSGIFPGLAVVNKNGYVIDINYDANNYPPAAVNSSTTPVTSFICAPNGYAAGTGCTSPRL